MRPDQSTLGANVGFGYLTDDDDDDASGGAPPSSFDALVDSALVSTSPTGTPIAIEVDITAAIDAQTNGVVVVSISSSGTVVLGTPSTTALDGWSQSGWSLAGGVWTNTLTRAAVSVGTTSPTFSVTATSGSGSVSIATNSSAPRTAEATGSGNSRSVTISAASFDAIGTVNGTPTAGSSVTWVLYATAGGSAQNNGVITLIARGFITPTTTNLDGWSESGWVQILEGLPPGYATSPVWGNQLTRTSVDVGATNPEVNIDLASAIAGDDVYLSTGDPYFDLPQTDEASGAGDVTHFTVV